MTNRDGGAGLAGKMVAEEAIMRNNGLSEQAVEFILTRNIEELAHLTEAGISQVLGANQVVLRRLFKISQDISLERFILREKLHRAIYVLERGPEISVKKLSEELGFRKVEDFIKEFEGYMAITPGRYKKIRFKSKKRKQASL
jgi:AraC-like DNA-binding protein